METLFRMVAGQVVGSILGRAIYAIGMVINPLFAYSLYRFAQRGETDAGGMTPEIATSLSALLLAVGLYCAWLFFKPSRRDKPKRDKLPRRKSNS